MIKFLNVPNAYDLADVKHADFAGMFWTFANGETWLTHNSKRLWLIPNYNDNLERSSDAVDDWPVMGPEELHEALAAFPLYEDLLGDFEAVLARNNAAEAEPGHLESRATCSTARCHTSGDCYRYSTSILNCYRCNNHRCTVMHLQPNFIGKGPNPH
ncbi:uncharacterized protein TRIVIDRAFT_62228 [Trichoderma virens Gv29-8]|uniref:Uncharacterized protein n=1 Tax=Hypocrea virens (strain Gv29-8 / FGSC 10586) TaxID=413071 RepID=G9MJ93_HYPVG|nr:uncharacterized protein TRIVIDRAFT_62228 [Trichoderma virens Gv29-8]EHK25556.1 hypothetical protein TRIVIDRAFT_62228 [Trichoderma virens Gv29-8]UKZ48623.1 hypothetical protein TrVGV298_002850 [Trichoderma virens]